MIEAHKQQPQLSVVICVRNGAPHIAHQLSALSRQEATVSWEVVVSDNGSTDDTVGVVMSVAEDFPVALRVVDASSRTGVSHARNVGASAARGKLLAFCDSDDAVAPGWVQAAAEGLAKVELLGGALRELTSDPRGEKPGAWIEGGSYVHASFGGAVIGCNFAVRRDSYFAVGGFDESLPPYGCDDVEFSLRANTAGLVVGQSSDMVVHFRRTTGTRDVLRKVYLSAQAEAVVWFRHRDRYGDRLRLPTLLAGVVTMIPTAVRGLAVGDPPRSLARQAVTRLGNVVGYWKLVRRDPARPLLVSTPLETREALRPGSA